MTKVDALRWMNEQIVACTIQSRPLGSIRNLNYNDNRIHVSEIDILCELVNMSYKVEPHSDEYDCHYFMYKGYKFFGLIERNSLNERK